MMTDFLAHHGIKGQEWGVRNGPPYPLKGHNVKRVDYEAKSSPTIIKRGSVAQTLSKDKDRTKDSDFYYAALTDRDKNFYNAMFQKVIKNDEVDENGKRIGPAFHMLYKIRNKANKDIKVADEKASVEAFTKCIEKSKDFWNFVTDPKRMESLMSDNHKKNPAYEESIKTLEKVRKRKNQNVSSEDLYKIYRFFNYTIPNEDPDLQRQRARFFKELKSQGYGATIDTNDSHYGTNFKRENPVIIFDTSNLSYLDSKMGSILDIPIATVKAMLYGDIK